MKILGLLFIILFCSIFVAIGGKMNGTIHPSYGSSSFEEGHRGLESVLRSARRVRVYYDHTEPSRSMLSVGFYSGSLALFFGGSLFFCAGLGFMLTFGFALAGNWDVARGITVLG